MFQIESDKNTLIGSSHFVSLSSQEGIRSTTHEVDQQQHNWIQIPYKSSRASPVSIGHNISRQSSPTFQLGSIAVDRPRPRTKPSTALVNRRFASVPKNSRSARPPRVAESKQTPQCRRLPCRAYISTGTCPFGDECHYLHDPRAKSVHDFDCSESIVISKMVSIVKVLKYVCMLINCCLVETYLCRFQRRFLLLGTIREFESRNTTPRR